MLPVTANPPQYFDLKLTADAKVTTMRFQKNDLYVISYQAQSPQKNWLELQGTTDTKHSIDGSLLLATVMTMVTWEEPSTKVSTLPNSKIPNNSTAKAIRRR